MNLHDALAAANIPPPPATGNALSGGFIRYGKSNRYWFKQQGGVALFGDWLTGESHHWFEDNGGLPDAAQVEARKQRLIQLRKEQEAEQQRIHNEIADRALKLWEGLSEAGSSAYLAIKQVEGFGIRFSPEAIVIPVRDVDGKLWSLQHIYQDGTKRFMSGGKKKGCCHIIGTVADKVFIAEGYATAASIHMATELPVVVVFDAGNIEPVVEALRKKYTALHITIAADNDQWGDHNTGKEKADNTGKKQRCAVILPAFKDTSSKPTDFNDLHVLEGLEAVKAQLLPAQEAETQTAILTPSARAREKRTEANKGVQFPAVELWHEPVEGAAMLTDVVATIRRFIVCDKETAIATTLWCAFTWFIDHVEVAPLAVITAPEKRCGKSQLLNLMGRLVRNPLVASNISPSATFRVIEAYQPTLLIDEADTFFKDNEELRGVINSGHTRQSAYVIRNVGEKHEPQQFSTWGAKAISGIGNLPDTIMDRAIILTLRRKLPDEQVQRLRHAEPSLFTELASKLARFADDAGESIRCARPTLPEALNDRAQDNWEPLLAIADHAGGEWPKLARTAAMKLSNAEHDTLSLSAELLADIKEVFDHKQVDRISTAELIEALCADDEKSWATYNRGKPISPRQFGRRLGEYGIHSKTIRVDFKTAKGFELDQFADAFARYLASTPLPSVTTSQMAPSLDGSVTDRDFVTVTGYEKVTRKPAPSLDCDVVTDKRPLGGMGSMVVEGEL